ncbi:unnamed protein product [Auanema sp. JU1783]|nr:unnamed protein product [Auanema sp. JU1783]
MGGVSSEAVLRRLQDVRNISQESIETISLWIMHYKDKSSINAIVNGWLTCFENASCEQQRVALFYIMNDVVQKAKSKHIDYLIPSFQPAVLAAVQIGRHSKTVKQTMDRCIGIFAERQVFAKESITAMKNILANAEVTDGDESGVELDVQDLVNKLAMFQKGRDLVHHALEIMKSADFNFQESRCKARDRHEVTILETETKEATQQLVALRHSMEIQKKKMLLLVEMLEIAKRQFSHQLRDVTVAEDAYQKFYQGIRVVKSELKEMEKTGIYPGATPPRDAPSPTPNDDIYATGVENVLQKPTRDNHDMTDMEIGDEDEDISNSVTSVAINPMMNLIQYPYNVDWKDSANLMGCPPPSHLPYPTNYNSSFNDTSIRSSTYSDGCNQGFSNYRIEGRDWKRNVTPERAWSSRRNDRNWKGSRGKRDSRNYGRQHSRDRR